MPPPLSSPWVPKCLPSPSRWQRSSSFQRPTRSHAHRCSRLMCQHGDEQSGLVTLTFDLESGIRVTCDVGYICANFGLPKPLCSQLRADVRDKQRDRYQTASSLIFMPLPIRGGCIIRHGCSFNYKLHITFKKYSVLRYYIN